MACKLRQRKDDIPKRKGEKTWVCDECNALIFAPRKPHCREEMLKVVQRLHDEAQETLEAVHVRVRS